MPLMNWEDAAYLRKDADGSFIPLEEYERRTKQTGRLPLSTWEVKLLVITGAGFFLDSYDLFIINLVAPVWQYEYWGGLTSHPKGGHYPPGLRGLVNAGANIGNIFGQLTFGFLGDLFGRKFVYGKELIVCIIGMILVISLPNSIPTSTLKMIWIFCWRLLMGAGIGGDYPMSASIVSERDHLKRRGAFLGWIFSNQGWGMLAGSIVTITVLACFEPALNVRGEYNQLDAVWRLQMGIALVPALIILPFRLTMPEGKKYLESKELNYSTSSSLIEPRPEPKPADPGNIADTDVAIRNEKAIKTQQNAAILGTPDQGTKWNAFIVYFSEWRHLRTLLGTSLSWFLLDIAFYGTNLNQSVILTDIGFSTGKNEYHTLMRNALGNLIVAVAGYVPRYFITIALIEVLGRKWIQIQGFLICALMFGILAGDYGGLSTAGKFVLFAIAQFFFNFGPNSTTFIIPAEVFPSRVRGSAHGLSAATGKLGAILAALLFNFLSSNIIGLPNVLWIFFACNILGAIITFLLLPEMKGRDADLIDWEEIQEARRNNMEHGKTK